MKTDVSKFSEFRKYYLSEFEWFDGEEYITFNLVGIDLEKGEAQVAVTDRGKISVITYDLMTDKNGRLYFEYGAMYTRIYPDDFEEAAYSFLLLYYAHPSVVSFQDSLCMIELEKEPFQHFYRDTVSCHSDNFITREQLTSYSLFRIILLKFVIIFIGKSHK